MGSNVAHLGKGLFALFHRHSRSARKPMVHDRKVALCQTKHSFLRDATHGKQHHIFRHIQIRKIVAAFLRADLRQRILCPENIMSQWITGKNKILKIVVDSF